MIQSTNFPLSTYSLQKYGSWEALSKVVSYLGLDGLEFIADPDNLPEDVPHSLVAGYHMRFDPDWVDFFRQNKGELIRKFGSMEFVESFYRCKTPEDLIRAYRDDLRLAIRLGAPYTVFHVSDVSLEEGYTYKWLHTDYEVLDAAIELINEILKGVEPTFDFLVENQWWPGFKFTETEKTEYLLSRINYPRVGIMLDTGHLMNTNWKIDSQWTGIKYIMEMIEKHGELSKRIYGLHFHQSVSGAYCRKTVGRLPEDFPLNYYDEFTRNYAQILKIDRHQHWTTEECVMILGCVQLKYLTHEISSGVYHGKKNAIMYQKRMINWGYHCGFDKMTVSEMEEYREERKHPTLTGNWIYDHFIRGIPIKNKR